MGYLDLFSGTVGFVLLQRWGRRKTELDFREKGGEEVIWDTVIDDKGFRADVVGSKQTGYYDLHTNPVGIPGKRRPVSFMSPAGDEEIEVLERSSIEDSPTLSLSPHEQTQLSDEEIRDHIVSQLPEGAYAVITSQTVTAKTVKVEIYDTAVTEVSAPPGTVMIAERFSHADGEESAETSEFDVLPKQTVFFRTALKRSSSAEIEPSDKLRLTASSHAHPDPMDLDDMIIMGSSSSGTIRPQQSEAEEDDGAVAVQQAEPEPKPAEEPLSSHKTSAPASRLPNPVANQKRARQPVISSLSDNNDVKASFGKTSLNRLTGRTKANTNGRPQKPGPFKKALQSLSPSQSSTAIKDIVAASSPSTSSKDAPVRRSQINGSESAIPRMTVTNPVSGSTTIAPKHLVKQDHGVKSGKGGLSADSARPSSKQSYYSVHEKRRDSLISETYSTHSIESRPGSPTLARTHMRSTSGLSKTKSEIDVTVWGAGDDPHSPVTNGNHQRSKSFVPSLYSMATKGSEDALILVPRNPLRCDSLFDDHEILTSLSQNGKVPGIFPNQHLVRNTRRFARFSSASYGSNFLRLMGLTTEFNPGVSTELQMMDVHHEHSSFSNHTGLPAHTILLSSFVDPQGVGGAANSSPSAISPLVHFVSIDHDSHAVVLTCRGTLGFEDVLTDMLCDYDDLYWQGRPYKVHKGIHASARRLLGGSGGRVMATLKAALEEYPTFGLILCGHSLGGAVAALLAMLISEPSTVERCGALFATAPSQKLISDPDFVSSSGIAPPISLPSGRPIHVYAYGTPATVSPSLRLATRGLITTVVNSADIVPSLSLGVLHDFLSVALNLKTDTTGAINALKTRVWQRIKHAVQSAFYVDSGPPPPENTAGDGLGEDTWAWAALKTLRAGMRSEKLVPPGEVFVVETTRVFDRQSGASPVVPDTATERVFRSLGRPATRVQMKFVRDVETRFGELRFGSNMFSDHSPGRYEASLTALERGILEV